ncbi:MAG: hypothetical protein ABWW66_03935 [Archaeoglobaceae archaeon]
MTGVYHVQAHFVGSLYHRESWSDPVVEVYAKPSINVNVGERVATNFVLEGSVSVLAAGWKCASTKIANGWKSETASSKYLSASRRGSIHFPFAFPEWATSFR